MLWTDHGSNFVRAAQDLADVVKFLCHKQTQEEVSSFCTCQNIQWKFILQHTPRFGGLWEAAVKSLKPHLRRIVGSMTLTFEEMVSVVIQIENYLNSRPLIALPSDDDGIVPAQWPH